MSRNSSLKSSMSWSDANSHISRLAHPSMQSHLHGHNQRLGRLGHIVSSVFVVISKSSLHKGRRSCTPCSSSSRAASRCPRRTAASKHRAASLLQSASDMVAATVASIMAQIKVAGAQHTLWGTEQRNASCFS